MSPAQISSGAKVGAGEGVGVAGSGVLVEVAGAGVSVKVTVQVGGKVARSRGISSVASSATVVWGGIGLWLLHAVSTLKARIIRGGVKLVPTAGLLNPNLRTFAQAPLSPRQ